MKLKTWVLETLIWNSSKFSFWIDYLRLKITDVKSPLIHKIKNLSNLLDYDNSNYWIFSELWYDLTYHKIKLSNWKWLIFSYSFFWVSVPLFIVIEYSIEHKSLFNSWWKLDFYWSYFRLKEVNEFTWFLFWDFLNDYQITRIDYRIDFFNYKNKIIDKSVINSRINSREVLYKTNWYINSWKFWNSLNKTIVVRWYDKKLDISKKWKFRLYSDYNNYDDIFRLEWEFLNRFCKWFTLSSLYLLVDKCKSYIWFNWFSDYSKYLSSYNKLDLSDEYQRSKYCKVMSSYIKEALKNQVNVYDFVDIELWKLWLSKTDILLIRSWNSSIPLLFH